MSQPTMEEVTPVPYPEPSTEVPPSYVMSAAVPTVTPGDLVFERKKVVLSRPGAAHIPFLEELLALERAA